MPSLSAMSLDRVEWEHINRVLVDCGGNISEAATLARSASTHAAAEAVEVPVRRYPSNPCRKAFIMSVAMRGPIDTAQR